VKRDGILNLLFDLISPVQLNRLTIVGLLVGLFVGLLVGLNVGLFVGLFVICLQ
jgi:uncharacterized membrane protein